MLPAVPWVHTCDPCYGVPTPSAPANFRDFTKPEAIQPLIFFPSSFEQVVKALNISPEEYDLCGDAAYGTSIRASRNYQRLAPRLRKSWPRKLPGSFLGRASLTFNARSSSRVPFRRQWLCLH